jgi:PKD repeat protein
MEEHRVISRNGNFIVPDAGHPDDASREDLVNLDGSESVLVWRQFRDFVGPYVAHCHNLAHEDHAMMFGWEILPAPVVAPVANAGGPYTVTSAGTTTLSGSATGTTPITYLWSASAGTFSDPTILNPVYTAPAVTTSTIITLSLTATNIAGSGNASATITVNPLVIADTVTITSSVYKISNKTLTITAKSSSATAVLKLMPYLPTGTGAVMFDSSLLGNTFKLSKGVWKLILSGVPQPATGTIGSAGLQVKSSLGGISPKTALQKVTR